MKSFEDFLREGVVRKVAQNQERARSLLTESERKNRSLYEHLEKIGVKEENANDYVEYCYDILLHAIRARLYADGYKAGGQGAHEAEVSYLRVMGFPETDLNSVDQMRYFRNGILYYGKMLDKEYAEKCIGFTKTIFNKLKSLLRDLLPKR